MLFKERKSLHESTTLTRAFDRATKEAKRKQDFSQGREVGSVSKNRSQYLLDKKTGIPEREEEGKWGKGGCTRGQAEVRRGSYERTGETDLESLKWVQ